MLLYALPAGLLTLGVYAAGFVAKRGQWDPGKLADWVTYHTPDSAFSFDVWRSSVISLQGNLRLFLGGKLSLFREHRNLWVVATALVAAGLFVALWPQGEKRRSPANKCIVVLCAVWIGTYVAFLFFWLPQNTFYRLFYLPALVVLAVAAVLVVWNLLFFVYPHSRVEANAPLEFALGMEKEWPKGSVIYLGSFHADAWLMWYFHPRTVWKTVSVRDLDGLDAEMRAVYAQGATAWADASLVSLLSADASGREWLRAHTWEGEGETRFRRLFPRAER